MMRQAISIFAVYLLLMLALIALDRYPALNDAFSHLALVLTAYVGLRWNEYWGMAFGLIAGFTLALLDGGGLTPLIAGCMAVGWLAALMATQVDTHYLPTQLAALFILLAPAGWAIPWLRRGSIEHVGVIQPIAGLIMALVVAGVCFPAMDRALHPPRGMQTDPLDYPANHRAK